MQERSRRRELDVDPARWPEVSRVFSAAVGLDRDARSAYLAEACRDDHALRNSVESLLRAHDKAGSFGEQSVLGERPGRRLSPGNRLGSFVIEAWIGAGGMGEVYRARDSRLQRAVAIKVLPDSFASDPYRRSRFEEEARALAALNHPHIGAIYGVEESSDVAALVLELVEGPTLGEYLATRTLAFDDIVRLARQLAEGLEAAHDRGVVHRDLKPGNIKITADGDLKILDFGLAKIAGPAQSTPPHLSPSSSSSPHVTQLGLVVGTAGYMSPEQARGEPVDKRTDIWAFGCVLFEMCARRPAFAGPSADETLAAVTTREPDWADLTPDTPPHVARLLRRCLTKDSKSRLRDIGEARIALAAPETLAGDSTAAPRGRAGWRTRIAAVVAAIAVGMAMGVAIYRRSQAPVAPMPVRFVVAPPEGAEFLMHPGRVPFVLSPDGSRLALVGAAAAADTASGPSRIWIRALGDLEARPLKGTEGARAVMWSPDGRSLAFISGDTSLKRIDLPDGAVVTICRLTSGSFRHGSWGGDGTILLGKGNGTVIEAVPASGGELRELLTIDPARGEVRVYWPWFLPDGTRFFYTARRDDGEGELRIGRLDGSSVGVMPIDSNAQLVAPDIVVYAHDGVLMWRRINLATGLPVGQPHAITERVEYFFTTSRAMFSTSLNGTVAYHPGGDLSQLVWADRNGRERGTIGDAHNYQLFSGRLSRDDTQLLTARVRPDLGTPDIWRLDLTRGTEERITTSRGTEATPMWIDDERAIAFGGDSPGTVPHLFRKDLTTGVEEPLLPPGNQQFPMDVLEDGSLAYVEHSPPRGAFLMYRLPMSPRGSPSPLLPSHPSGLGGRLSPDKRAVAFLSREGEDDLYVATVAADATPAVLVAQGAQGTTRFSRDGKELFFVGRDFTLMSVSIRTGPPLVVGTARPLFRMRPRTWLLDVSRDGRFVLLEPRVRAASLPVVVGTSAIPSLPR